jgi:hypothetical protein
MSLSFMFFFFLIFVFFIDPLTASGKQALNYNRIHAMTKTAFLSAMPSEEKRQRETPLPHRRYRTNRRANPRMHRLQIANFLLTFRHDGIFDPAC